MNERLTITTPSIRSKLRISRLQILEGRSHAVLTVHQWMSPLEHTNVLSGPPERQGRHCADVCFFLRSVGSDVGLQMSPIIMEPSTLNLHPRVERGIVECSAKHAFIYRNGVH